MAADDSVVGRLSRFRNVMLPQARLSAEAYRVRHRALRVVLWLQLPLLGLVALLNSDDAPADMPGMDHSTSGGQFLIQVMAATLTVCALASLVIRSHRGGAGVVSLGLLLSAALLVSIGGGLTDLHFAYFLVIGLISVYQDWLWMVMSVVLVTVQHLIMGTLAPAMLYSGVSAWNAPVRFALLHAGFVLGTCAVQIAYWQFIQRAQLETDQVRAENERGLRRSAERFEALVQDSSDVLTVVGPDGRIVSASTAAERVMGYRPAGLTGVGYHSLIHPDDAAQIDLGTGDGRERRAEARTRHADGSWHWHEVTMQDMFDNPVVAGWVINHRDVTERRMFQQRLEHEASHDALTGLPNRGRLLGELQKRLADTTPGRPGLAVLYLDLDGFKQVNDRHGHETGDALLIAVAHSLRRCVLGGDMVGRLGGDEFAAVLDQVYSPEDAITVATRILADVARPVAINGKVISARVSIGIALADSGSIDTDELLHRADTAMYHAKRDAGILWRLYVDGMHDPGAAGVTLEDDLRRAVGEDQLRVQYQPVVALDSGALLGVEALLRWQHPRLGLLLPDDFIALAEQSDLIDEIGQWVLDHACRQVRRWQQRLGPGVGIGLSVNVSARQFETGTFVDRVQAILSDADFAPGDLTLEIAESAMVNVDALTAELALLQGQGVRIALDHFGAGHSSLRHLSRLPVGALKLDRCFVAELNGEPEGSAVAEAVIRLGSSLQLDTVAVGIESLAQVTELTLLGCRAGQGFYFSYPLDAADLDSLIHAGQRPVFPIRAVRTADSLSP